ncbi:type I restriction endonuclease subunit M [Acidovorax sp. SUPP1855]|uniref:hypothetical protein n=1 Tax=Acidovorax sp. SUPP1855 TaxID=431774 RepID=UPI0023DE6A8F|nr:hypothetical protein [Acidovorax sp. SUPP1855]GKS83661.1 type I restriction endonuclease subunit M [Acidovorax sp. SUPP1855]
MALALLSSTQFQAGQLIMTQGVNDLVQQGRIDPLVCLRRHLNTDWGDLSDSDWQSNDTALRTGQDRLFSSYELSPILTLWIITEWDRSVTTLLLPSEY